MTRTKSKEVKIRMRRDHRFFNMIRENIGDSSVTDLEDKDDQIIDVMVGDTIDEITFYKCFLHLKSSLAKTVYDPGDGLGKLTDVTIEYMAKIMSMPLEYTMPTNAKNMVQTNLAKSLGRTSKSAYSAINRLKKAGYLEVTEDNIIMPVNELQRLRKVTKAHLDKYGAFPISYMLNFIVA